MTSPTRLLDGAGEPYARELLTSASLDEPDDAALERCFAGLASVPPPILDLAGAGNGAAAPAGGALAAGGSAGAPHVAAGGTSAAIIVKWLGIGVLGGFAAAGGIEYVGGPSSAGSSEQSIAVESSDLPVGAGQAPASRVEATGAPRVPAGERSNGEREQPRDGTGRSEVRQRARSASERLAAGAPPASVVASPSGPRLLAEDVARLDRAREALATGDAQQALVALDDYAAQKKTGVLDREALIVRIDALLARGQKRRAAELARRYVALFPADAHSERLRKIATSE